jgi:hypothetical protein
VDTEPGAEPAARWPADLDDVFEKAVTTEYATLTRDGQPITVPTTPYVGPGGATLEVSTGLTYPAKAERARRNPMVSLLYADPVGSGLGDAPVVLVQGLAAVHDADLQENTDRYLRESAAKLPETYSGQPALLLRRMPWYFARIWVSVTPTRIRWWPSRALDGHPEEWRAPVAAGPVSDPAPAGPPPPPWLPPPPAWPPVADDAIARLHLQDLTVVDADGFPLTLPLRSTRRDGPVLVCELGPAAPAVAPAGRACVTFHTHPETFTGQENRTLVGTVVDDRAADGSGAGSGAGRTVRVEITRALADWSLAGNRLTITAGFLKKGRVLKKRLRSEAARRGQPVPKVNLP